MKSGPGTSHSKDNPPTVVNCPAREVIRIDYLYPRLVFLFVKHLLCFIYFLLLIALHDFFNPVSQIQYLLVESRSLHFLLTSKQTIGIAQLVM